VVDRGGKVNNVMPNCCHMIKCYNSKMRNLCYLHYIITHIILANQKAELLVYLWLHAHAWFDITSFTALVRASDVISSILSIHFLKDNNNKRLAYPLEGTPWWGRGWVCPGRSSTSWRPTRGPPPPARHAPPSRAPPAARQSCVTHYGYTMGVKYNSFTHCGNFILCV